MGIHIFAKWRGAFGSRAHPTRLTVGYLQLKPLSKVIEVTLSDLCLDQSSVVVDLGCGDTPYLSFFHEGGLYVGVDRPSRNECNAAPIAEHSVNLERVCGTADFVPLKNGCADLVLCTQVLEHVEDPMIVVSEIGRLLKVGGTAIVSTHGIFPVHPCPDDFWRWTDSGLRKLFSQFEMAQVIAANATIPTIMSLLEDEVYHSLSQRQSLAGIALSSLARWVINLAGDVAEKVRPNALSRRPLVGIYVVIAKRTIG